jgi:hypothetical protein
MTYFQQNLSHSQFLEDRKWQVWKPGDEEVPTQPQAVKMGGDEKNVIVKCANMF